MTHTVNVVANGVFGINELRIPVDFGYHADADIKEIQKAVMLECAARGYTSILSYKKIDEEKEAAMIFNGALYGCTHLVQEVILHLDGIASCSKEIADIERRRSEGDEWANGQYGAGRIDFLKQTKREHQLFIRNAHDTLALCDIDVDDREGQRQVLTNMGFYRTNM